ncbi:TetR/AcrR family transcriptional regulator [Nannocystis sp. ILAH1]|uniref:TetR/AcrR family transcriptional regulator n=1 Tax=unclassified Nannocystis TaxID=2627009 RepID=UPI002270CE4C|nr:MULTISPECIES: TetR/AcrR family transcriptional regulator [unclassified Nannocystis]MCY0986546.1 TetR/AcrR family transcriptional regulator [Nannocystis sp. ILAH1]MCY1071426.1 TetR/AcrR family transcriptional regulator [Nannocystis sp. RBIL2]
MPRIAAPTIAAHREATWQRLREGFIRAVHEEGYGALTLAAIARHAGIARNTIYNYAPTKDALLVAVVKAEAAPIVSALVEACAAVEDPEDRLALLVRRQLAALAPGVSGISIVNALEGLLPEDVSMSLAACFAPVFEIVAGIVQQGTAAGLFRPVADVQRLVERMVGVVHAGRRAVASGAPVEVVAAETAEFLLGGLRGRADRQS